MANGQLSRENSTQPRFTPARRVILNRIEIFMRRKNMTPTAFCQAVGVEKKTVRRLTSGQGVSLTTIEKIETFLTPFENTEFESDTHWPQQFLNHCAERVCLKIDAQNGLNAVSTSFDFVDCNTASATFRTWLLHIKSSLKICPRAEIKDVCGETIGTISIDGRIYCDGPDGQTTVAFTPFQKVEAT